MTTNLRKSRKCKENIFKMRLKAKLKNDSLEEDDLSKMK